MSFRIPDLSGARNIDIETQPIKGGKWKIEFREKGLYDVLPEIQIFGEKG